MNLLYIAGVLVGGFIFAKLIGIFGEFAMQALKRSEENKEE